MHQRWQANMCLAHSAMKSLTIESCAHFVLDSIVRMAIRRFVDHQPVGAISRYIDHHSVFVGEEMKKEKHDENDAQQI